MLGKKIRPLPAVIGRGLSHTRLRSGECPTYLWAVATLCTADSRPLVFYEFFIYFPYFFMRIQWLLWHTTI